MSSPLETAGRPEKSGALSPTLMTLLYLPAKAGMAIKRNRREARVEPFAWMLSPVGSRIQGGRCDNASPLIQPIGTSLKIITVS